MKGIESVKSDSSMSLTAGEIAEIIGGELHGDGKIVIDGLSGLDTAKGNELSFLANPKYRKLVSRSKAGVIILPYDFDGEPPEGSAWIQVEDPNVAFSEIALKLIPAAPPPAPGIHPDATVSDTAEIGNGVSIAAQAVVEDGVRIGNGTFIGAGVYIGRDVSIGQDCKIHPNVSVRENCVLGNRVTIHCNSVVGADGFGYEPDIKGHKKIHQLGYVQIDDDVEIGSCTTVDRARFGKTWIQSDVKIDNLCQIAHNAVIGRGCFMMAQAGVAGSASIGNYVAMFARVAVPGHIHVGDFSKLLGNCVPIDDVPEKSELIGFPAVNRKDYFRQIAAIKRLPDTLKQVRALAKQLKELEDQLSGDEGSDS